MKAFVFSCCFAVLTVFSSHGQTPGLHRKLAGVIDSLYAADQRTALLKPADSAAAAYQRVSRTNFPVVEQIVATYGYPTYALIGEESAKHYFLLVQHSDFNLPFQQRVLPLMRRAVRQQQASGQQYAFLTDRIAINQGNPQVYGTQVRMSSHTQVKPCIAPANLNKRRESVGLDPIEVYIEKCNAVFYELNPQEKTKAAAP